MSTLEQTWEQAARAEAVGYFVLSGRRMRIRESALKVTRALCEPVISDVHVEKVE